MKVVREKKTSLRHFEVACKIHDGDFGSVYKAIRKSDGLPYALKAVNISRLTKKELRNSLTEVRVLSSVRSPYLVSYKEAFLNRAGTELYVVMEYVGGGDLFSKLQACAKKRIFLHEEAIWRYFTQGLLGLGALHSVGVLHRDVKSSNLLLTEDLETVKIGDLNVAKVSQENVADTRIGTPVYMAPEVWKGSGYDAKCDVFSLGCVLFEMAALKRPFESSNPEVLRQKMASGQVPKIPCVYSQDLYTIIRLCLTPNPAERPDVDALLDHPIIQSKLQLSRTDLEAPVTASGMLPTIQFKKVEGGYEIALPKKKKYVGATLVQSRMARIVALKCNNIHSHDEASIASARPWYEDSVTPGRENSAPDPLKAVSRGQSPQRSKEVSGTIIFSSNPARYSARERILQPKLAVVDVNRPAKDTSRAQPTPQALLQQKLRALARPSSGKPATTV